MDKNYDLLQEGNDWTVISYNPHAGCWQKMTTFYDDSWGKYAKTEAQNYINQRKEFVDELASVILCGC